MAEKTKLTPEQRAHAASLYQAATALQGELWDTLSEIEVIIGCAVSAEKDLGEYGLDYFIEQNEPV